MEHAQAGPGELQAGPFISYSRQDLEFATRLYDALRRRNRDAWVDLKGIEPSEEWHAKLHAAIDSSQAFVFVISEASLASPYCGDEIRRAKDGNKKLIPLLYRPVAAEQLPPSLARLQWISFQQAQDFEARVDDLVRALDTDLEWTGEHTRLLVRAREWERERRDKSYLLRGKDLKAAEQWLLDSARGKERQPSTLQGEFIGASVQAQRLARNRQLALAIAAAVVSIGLALAALYQRNQAQTNERQAVSRLLAAQATGGLERNLNLALLQAVAAYQRAPTFEARQALRSVIEKRPHLSKYLYGQTQRVQRLAFDADGALLAASSMDGRVIVWNTGTGAELFRHESGAGRAPAIALSSQAGLLAIAGQDGAIGLHGSVDGKLLQRLDAGQRSRIDAAAFSPDGQLLAWGGEGAPVTVWHAPSRQLQCRSAEAAASPVTALRFAADGKSLASTDYRGTTIVRDAQTCRKDSALASGLGGMVAAVSADLSRTAVTDPGFPEVGLADLIAGSTRKAEIPQADFLLAADFDPRAETLALGTRGAEIILWDPAGNKTRRTLRGHTADVTSVAFDRSGRWLASGSIHGEVILWNLKADWPMQATRRLAGAALTNLFFAGDGERLVATDRKGRLQVIGLGDGQATDAGISWPAEPASITVGADGRRVAARIGQRLVIRDARDGAAVDEFALAAPAQTPPSFSPDGSHLGFADGSKIYLRDIGRHQSVQVGATASGQAVFGFAPAGDRFAVVASQRSVAVLDTRTRASSTLAVPGHID